MVGDWYLATNLITLITGKRRRGLVSPEDVLLQPVCVAVALATDVAGVRRRRRRAVVVDTVSARQVDAEVVLGPLDGLATD